MVQVDGRTVARVFSTSSTAPHLFGDRLDDYERGAYGGYQQRARLAPIRLL
jgi:hypothetical protein